MHIFQEEKICGEGPIPKPDSGQRARPRARSQQRYGIFPAQQ